jgi:hypothetical protein
MEHNVIVSFSTTPYRIRYIAPVVRSICENQTVKPTALHLYIPEVFGRTGDSYVIPLEIQQLQDIYPFRICRVSEDKGPITKVFFALQEFKRDNDLVICIDDDVVYPEHFIEEFLEAHKERSDCLLGYMGCNPPSRPFIHAERIQFRHSKRMFEPVITLGGYRGILFPRSLVSDDFFTTVEDVNSIHQKCHGYNILDDDAFLAYYFKKRGIPKIVFGTFYPGNLFANNIIEQINIRFLESGNHGGLNSPGNMQKMKNSLDILKKYFGEV